MFLYPDDPEVLTHEWVMQAYYEYTRRLSAYDNRHRNSNLRTMIEKAREAQSPSQSEHVEK